MGELTATKPKCLVEVGGRSLLDWQLAAMRAAGIDDIAIVTGYQADAIPTLGLKRFKNPRWSSTNMVRSLQCASEWLAAHETVVSYSDIIFDKAAVSVLRSCTAPIGVTYDPSWLSLWEERFDEPLSDAESFDVGPGSILRDIGRTNVTMEEISGQYMGLLLFRPEGWVEFSRHVTEMDPEIADKIHMTNMLQRIIDAGRISIEALPYEGRWAEIDDIRDREVAEVIFRT